MTKENVLIYSDLTEVQPLGLDDRRVWAHLRFTRAECLGPLCGSQDLINPMPSDSSRLLLPPPARMAA